MKKFFKDFSAGRAVLHLFSISLLTATLVNAQTPAGPGSSSSSSSSAPAQGQAPASTTPGSTAPTTTTPTTSTADKGSDAKKSADPKALINQVEKANDKETTAADAQSNEDTEEAYRQAELNKMRRKILDTSFLAIQTYHLHLLITLLPPVTIPLGQGMN